jgi:hypothetical protein
MEELLAVLSHGLGGSIVDRRGEVPVLVNRVEQVIVAGWGIEEDRKVGEDSLNEGSRNGVSYEHSEPVVVKAASNFGTRPSDPEIDDWENHRHHRGTA